VGSVSVDGAPYRSVSVMLLRELTAVIDTAPTGVFCWARQVHAALLDSPQAGTRMSSFMPAQSTCRTAFPVIRRSSKASIAVGVSRQEDSSST
jgi:hypothetical protein